MIVFEEACLLSCELWLDSFPTDIPKHDFSKKHQKKMNRLFDKMRNDKYHRFTKNAIKIILVAAILLSITTTALAIPSCREFLIKKFKTHSAYNILDNSDIIDVEYLSLGYIPDGFIKNDEFKSDNFCIYSYMKNSYGFSVQKFPISTTVNFDTEKNESIEKDIDGIRYIVYKAAGGHQTGIIFNNGKYIYMLTGNIEENELLKIAQNAE